MVVNDQVNQFVRMAMNLYKQGMLDYESMCESCLCDMKLSNRTRNEIQEKVLDRAQQCFEDFYLKKQKLDNQNFAI